MTNIVPITRVPVTKQTTLEDLRPLANPAYATNELRVSGHFAKIKVGASRFGDAYSVVQHRQEFIALLSRTVSQAFADRPGAAQLVQKYQEGGPSPVYKVAGFQQLLHALDELPFKNEGDSISDEDDDLSALGQAREKLPGLAAESKSEAGSGALPETDATLDRKHASVSQREGAAATNARGHVAPVRLHLMGTREPQAPSQSTSVRPAATGCGDPPVADAYDGVQTTERIDSEAIENSSLK